MYRPLYRGTIRRFFLKAWNMFVQLGMTDDSYVMEDSEKHELQAIRYLLPHHPTDSADWW
jgi:hypothetical protein